MEGEAGAREEELEVREGGGKGEEHPAHRHQLHPEGHKHAQESEGGEEGGHLGPVGQHPHHPARVHVP